jgi:hypothetical protein
MSKFNLLNLAYFLAFSLLNFSLLAQEIAQPEYTTDYADAVSYLYNLKTTGESAQISEEIIIKKDIGTIKMLEGELYKCYEFKGGNYALVFVGKGEFYFTPSTEIERKQLYRFYGTEKFSVNFKELFLLFDDNTYEQIIKGLTFQKSQTKTADDIIKSCMKYIKDDDYDISRSDFLRSVMVEGRNGFFYSQIQENSLEPVFFQVNPFELEEVSFMNGSHSGAKDYKEVINLFPSTKETLELYSSKKQNKYFLDLISYKIESTIKDNLDFLAKCIIDFNSTEKDQEWIMFYLYDELIVDSVSWGNGSKAKFVNTKESGELWIKCLSDYLDGNQHNLTVYYHGDLLEKNDLGWINLKSSIFWYPRYDNNEKAAFGLIFHIPTEYDIVSVGELVNKVQKDDVFTTTWFCNTPSRNISFSIGNFEVHEVKKENLPTVNVYISEYGHQQISKNLIQYGIYSMSDASEFIAQDVSSSLELFTELFGKLSFSSINVTEITDLHGEAFPGLINLSWATVIQTNFEGEDEIFRAHETAHQWWGVGVDFDNYHDQWLSEGFAEYSGLLYLQVAKNDNELFFDILNKWKNDILNLRNYIFGSGQEAGPIWLGYRTSSSSTPGDYDLIVYKKGAWILHMLRGMLLDLNTMNEDKMKRMMKEFYETYKNKKASTSDLKKIVDKHFGEDMSWFFNQYVYGTDIPRYNVAYKDEKTTDGKTIITLRIRQEEVPNNFKMYVPVKIVLDGERIGRIRIEVKGKETIFTTPPFEGELDKIVFNDLESVLCEIKYEDWD